jgi:hypothetical protein
MIYLYKDIIPYNKEIKISVHENNYFKLLQKFDQINSNRDY